MDDLFANVAMPPAPRLPVPAALPHWSLYRESHYEWSLAAAPWFASRMLDGGLVALDLLWWRVAGDHCRALRLAIWKWLHEDPGAHARDIRRAIFKRLPPDEKQELRDLKLDN